MAHWKHFFKKLGTVNIHYNFRAARNKLNNVNTLSSVWNVLQGNLLELMCHSFCRNAWWWTKKQGNWCWLLILFSSCVALLIACFEASKWLEQESRWIINKDFKMLSSQKIFRQYFSEWWVHFERFLVSILEMCYVDAMGNCGQLVTLKTWSHYIASWNFLSSVCSLRLL